MSDSTPPPPPPENPYGQTPYGQTPPPYGQTPPPAPGYGQNPYGAPAAYGAPGGRRPAELLDRFVARLIDFVILFVVNLVVVSVIVVGVLLGSSGGNGFSSGANYGISLLTSVLSAVIYLGYFVLLESTQGRTVGKIVMKLRTVGPDGTRKPTMAEAFKRNIFTGYGILGIIPVVGSLIGGIAALVGMILIAVQINGDPVKRQAWHDKFAGGTEVVKEG